MPQGQMTQIRLALAKKNLLGYLCLRLSTERAFLRIKKTHSHRYEELRYSEMVLLLKFHRLHSREVAQAHRINSQNYEHGDEIHQRSIFAQKQRIRRLSLLLSDTPSNSITLQLLRRVTVSARMELTWNSSTLPKIRGRWRESDAKSGVRDVADISNGSLFRCPSPFFTHSSTIHHPSYTVQTVVDAVVRTQSRIGSYCT